jgi:hypothetical protein
MKCEYWADVEADRQRYQEQIRIKPEPAGAPAGARQCRSVDEAYGMAVAKGLSAAQRRQAKRDYAHEYYNADTPRDQLTLDEFAHATWLSEDFGHSSENWWKAPGLLGVYGARFLPPTDWAYPGQQKTPAEVRRRARAVLTGDAAADDVYNSRHRQRRRNTIAAADRWVGRVFGMAGSAERTRRYRNRRKARKDNGA